MYYKIKIKIGTISKADRNGYRQSFIGLLLFYNKEYREAARLL